MLIPLFSTVSRAIKAAPLHTMQQRVSWSRALLCLPAIAGLVLFFAFPLAQNAARSFGISDIAGTHSSFTLQHYRALFTDPYYVGVVIQTLKVSAITTLVSLLLGYPVAYYMVRRIKRLAVPMLFVLVTPLLTSIIMRTFGWRVLFARHGLVSEFSQWLHLTTQPLRILDSAVVVYIAIVHVTLPFMILSIVPVLRSVDRRLEESARILGADAWRTFFLVTLPLSVEGVITGCVFVFMITNGSFVTMLLLGNGSVVTLPLLIFQQFSQSQDLGFASAMGNVLLIIVLVCLYIQGRLSPMHGRGR